ncbi:hypothetical protein [Syntrophomonas wolfei]|mgnify:CR=1 FL=1|uniref:hypothetical protein n=1 Tax=Syntrophomonas wolfei TaxID=863 RepID=UPI0012DC717A|nr:hypothetical protein [Syntrophomonas wolfei]
MGKITKLPEQTIFIRRRLLITSFTTSTTAITLSVSKDLMGSKVEEAEGKQRAPNRKSHYPHVLKVLLASTIDEIIGFINAKVV